MRSFAVGILAIAFAAFVTSCMDPHHGHGDRDYHQTGKPGSNTGLTPHDESTHSHGGNQLGKVPGTKPGSGNYTQNRN